MAVVTREPLNPAVLFDSRRGWRRMMRIDATGGSVIDVNNQTMALQPERLIYAEGDSWFDKFTPFGAFGTNLLDAIRTPFHTAVVDASHIGDEARKMVSGHQAAQTRALFELFDFDAVLLSAGGNDLKNVFTSLFDAKAQQRQGIDARFQPKGVDRLATPAGLTEIFDDVIANIGRFVDLRNAAGSTRTRNAPIFLHGYDYFQPRPAGAKVFAGSNIGSGPWLYPALAAAGLSDAAMLAAAHEVIDEMNRQLAAVIAVLPDVHVIDQRGLLSPAEPGSTGDSRDWLDEIHPNERGFGTLARVAWDVGLARALGWTPDAGDVA